MVLRVPLVFVDGVELMRRLARGEMVPGVTWFEDDDEGAPWIATTRAQRGRPPVYVALRSDLFFCVDARHVRDGKLGARGWRVSGDVGPERVSLHVEPSIRIGRPGEPGHWHGFIEHGFLRVA